LNLGLVFGYGMHRWGFKKVAGNSIAIAAALSQI
jgi:hypothetical protein